MPREKKKKKEIVLNKENLLIQPLALTLAGVNPTVIGNRVSVALVRRLQDAFKEIISDRKSGKEWTQLSIFATEEVKSKYLGENKIAFDIHMNELVDDPKHYQDAFDSICRLSDIKIFVPVFDDKAQEYVYPRVSLFDTVFGSNVEVTVPTEVKGDKSNAVTYEKMSFHDFQFGERNPKKIYHTDKIVYSYRKNTKPVIGITVEKIVAEYIFSFQKKYGDFLDYTAISTNDKYYTPIYIFISSHKYNKDGIVEIDYKDFRQKILGMDVPELGNSPYPEFSQFNKRILRPCMNQMKAQAEEGASDCYFDFEKIYDGGKRAQNPDKLRFHIYLSDLGKAIKEEKVNAKNMIGIERRLREQFDQTDKQVRAIMKAVPLNMRMELVMKMDSLLSMEKSGKIKIDKDRRAYFNSSFCTFIGEIEREKEMPTIPFPEHQEQPPTGKAADGGAAHENIPVSEEESSRFAAFLENLRGRVGQGQSARFSPLSIQGFDGKKLSIGVPNATLGSMIVDENREELEAALLQVYGEGICWELKVTN